MDEQFSSAVLPSHKVLVERITRRAETESSPLTPLELQLFDFDRRRQPEARTLPRSSEPEHDWERFFNRVSGLLRRSMEEDSLSDPSARQRYAATLHKLKFRPESFTLWAGCVPAFYNRRHDPVFFPLATSIIVFMSVFSILFGYSLR